MTLNGFASGLKYVLVASALFLVSLASCANAGAPSAVPARAPDEAGEPVCLTNIKWVLKTLNGRESAGEPFTLSFFEDGYLEGEAVCNSYGANYASGDGFRLSGELNKTNLECGATTTARQDEAAFLEIMSEADCLDARHGRLKIEDSAGDRTLIFVPRPPPPSDLALDGTEWVLVSLHGYPSSRALLSPESSMARSRAVMRAATVTERGSRGPPAA